MNEIKIANYTLFVMLLLIMSTFYVSMQSLTKSNDYGEYPSIISGYRY